MDQLKEEQSLDEVNADKSLSRSCSTPTNFYPDARRYDMKGYLR